MAAAEQIPVTHPEIPAFTGITIAQLSGPAHDPANSMRNAVTLSTGVLDWDRPSTWTGVLDRSPCGTGTSAKLACLAADGKLAPGEIWRQESIIGSLFEGSYTPTDSAIIPTITGRAWITGQSTLMLDPTDPWPGGYKIADTWPIDAKD